MFKINSPVTRPGLRKLETDCVFTEDMAPAFFIIHSQHYTRQAPQNKLSMLEGRNKMECSIK